MKLDDFQLAHRISARVLSAAVYIALLSDQ